MHRTSTPHTPVPRASGLRRRFPRALAGAAAGLLGFFALSGVAGAHVTIQPDQASQGSEITLTFRVPNEEADASTTGLRVQLPPDHPFASVSVQPTPGWTADTKTTTLATPIESDDGEVTEAVTEVDWSGGEIKPGEFQQFTVLIGPLPDDVDQLSFPAIQTYSNGDEVSWIEKPTADGQEPEHPAPVLELTAASSADSATTATTAVSSSGDETAAAATTTSSDSNNGLAIAAIVIGGLALVLAVVALVVGRRGSPSRT